MTTVHRITMPTRRGRVKERKTRSKTCRTDMDFLAVREGAACNRIFGESSSLLLLLLLLRVYCVGTCQFQNNNNPSKEETEKRARMTKEGAIWYQK